MANCSPHEKNNGSRGSVDRLTRRNLQSYTEKSRRDEAYRRGRSTPSSEPDLHEYNSLDSISAPPREAFKSVTAEQYAKVMKAARATDEWALRNDPNKDKILREFWPETDDTAVKSTAALEPSASSAQPTAIKNGRVAEEGLPAANQHESFLAGDNCARDTASAEKSVETQPDEIHKASGEENDPIAPPFLNISPHRYNGEENQPAQPTAAHSSPRPQQERVAPNPTLPLDFPTYHSTMNMNEISAYLANASYVISLGGPPLADLKYGIIVLPVGEESLLFGPNPNHVMSREFFDAIDDANRDYDKTQRLRDPDKDSADFLRHRFDDDFSSRPAESHHHIEIPVGIPNGVTIHSPVTSDPRNYQLERRGNTSLASDRMQSRDMGAPAVLGQARPSKVSKARKRGRPAGRRKPGISQLASNAQEYSRVPDGPEAMSLRRSTRLHGAEHKMVAGSGSVAVADQSKPSSGSKLRRINTSPKAVGSTNPRGGPKRRTNAISRGRA